VSLEGKRFIQAAEASNPDSGSSEGLDNR